ncbi:MAG TPA: hypothetical protein VHH73_19115 [Verrucomicrobiae bacterium]|nr:hypothetical protein [Verrucomicrobiae bacterium]
MEHAIVAWRAEQSARVPITSDDAGELETRLRGIIGELTGKKLTTEEAFLVATRRTGSAGMAPAVTVYQDIDAEARRRVFWMVAGQVLLVLWMFGWVWLQSEIFPFVPAVDWTPGRRLIQWILLFSPAVSFIWLVHRMSQGKFAPWLARQLNRLPSRGARLAVVTVAALILVAGQNFAQLSANNMPPGESGLWANARAWAGAVLPNALQVLALMFLLACFMPDRAPRSNSISADA